MTPNSADRRSARRWRSATRMRSAACSLALAIACVFAGCAATPQVTYLRESEKVIHLKQGEPAPHDGWLLSDDRLAEIYDLLDERTADEEPANP